jgi:hypothetical protein
VDEQTTVIGPSATADLRELQAHIKAKEDEYALLNARHTELWQLRKQAQLDREGYIDFLMVADRMEVLLHELEAAKPQLRYREVRAAAGQGVNHYNALVPAETEAATLVCTRWASFIQACAGFVEVSDQQIDPLTVLPAPDGSPAFELPSGQELLQRVIGGLPNTSGTVLQAVVWSIRQPLTLGDTRTVVTAVPGTQPFPPGLVERYLAGFQPDEPKPMEEA